MRVITRTGDDTYISTGFVTSFFVWLFVGVFVVGFLLLALAIMLVIYLAGCVYSVPRRRFRRWHHKFVAVIEHMAFGDRYEEDNDADTEIQLPDGPRVIV